MTLPRFKSTPVSAWLGAAFTEFVNGFIDGWGGAGMAGAGTGALTGTTQLGADMSALNQVIISVGAVGLSMLGAGIQAVYVWHKANRFPNPWPPQTGNTNPPFSSVPPQSLT